VSKLVLVDTHANPNTQRKNLAPNILAYAADNVPNADAKTDFSEIKLFIELKLAETQPGQHEADQHDGVFKFIETHLRDQPRPRPIDQRLTRLCSLRFKIPA
jgi:hypothetical protein